MVIRVICGRCRHVRARWVHKVSFSSLWDVRFKFFFFMLFVLILFLVIFPLFSILFGKLFWNVFSGLFLL